MAELERQLASAHRESQDRAAKAAMARAEGQRAAKRATAIEQGLAVVSELANLSMKLEDT